MEKKEYDWKDDVPPLTDEQKLGLLKTNPQLKFFNKIGLNFDFKWFDFWVGLFYDRKQKILYFCPFPTLVLSFWRMKS